MCGARGVVPLAPLHTVGTFLKAGWICGPCPCPCPFRGSAAPEFWVRDSKQRRVRVASRQWGRQRAFQVAGNGAQGLRDILPKIPDIAK